MKKRVMNPEAHDVWNAAKAITEVLEDFEVDAKLRILRWVRDYLSLDQCDPCPDVNDPGLDKL